MNEALHNEIIHRWQGGQSLRGIARDLGISRWNVSATIRRHQAARADGPVEASNSALPAPPGQRGSKLDAFESQIVQLLERYPRMTATRLFEELKQRGYRGGYTIVRERVRQLRGRQNKPLVQRFETAAGAQAQMDWAEYQIDFTGEGRRRRPTFGVCPPLQLPAELFAATIRLLYRAAGLRDHDSPAHPGLPAPAGSGSHVPLRQYEGGGHAVGG